MRLPIKFNRRGFTPWIAKWLPSRDDPRALLLNDPESDRFESSVSAIKVGDTWKSTQKNRHVLSDRMILDVIAGIDSPYILDIGASSGSTSLDLLELLGDRIGKYWITDLFFHLYAMRKWGATYFFHPLTRHCIMRVTDRLLVYEDTTNALPLFGWIARILISRAPVFDPEVARRVSMIHPSLRKRVEEEWVIIREHDVFDDWMEEKMDVVKVANVLNRQYFNDSMIKIVLEKLKDALKPGGYLIIIDNRKLEKASLFGLNEGGMFELRGEVNGGCEIKKLVC